MPVVSTLTHATSIDTKGWDRGFSLGEASVAKFSSDFGAKLDGIKVQVDGLGKSLGGLSVADIKAPTLDFKDTASKAGEIGESLGAALVPLGGQIQAAMMPLTRIAGTVARQFDQLGGTITTSLRRIDSHMKFDGVLKSIEWMRKGVDFSLDYMSGKFLAFGKGVAVALNFATPVYKAISWFKHLGDVTHKTLSQLSGAKPNLDFSGGATSILSLKGAADKATSSFRAMGGQVALALGAFGLTYKAVGFIKDGIKGASSLNETVSKTGAILGDQAGPVFAFADDYAKKFGLIKQETLDAASSFAGLGKGLGSLKGDQLSAFSVDLTKLAADLQSFANLGSLQEAGKALTIGLSGEQSDVLKRLGVTLLEDEVKAYAFSHGIAAMNSELSNAQKLAARSGIIKTAFDKLNISGDLARTAGETANQYRKLTGTITNLGVSIGATLLPAVLTGVKVFSGFAVAASSAFEGSKGLFGGFAETLSTGFRNIGALAEYLVGPILDIGKTIAGAFGMAGAGVAGVLPTFAQFADGAKAALVSANLGLKGLIAGATSLYASITEALGPGVIGMVAKFGAVLGASLLVGPIVAGAVALGGAIAACIPAFSTLAVAGAAFLAVWATGSTVSDVIASIGFVARNAASIFSAAWTTVTGTIKYIIDSIGLIPTNLGILADYIKGNWIQIITDAIAGAVSFVVAGIGAIPEAVVGMVNMAGAAMDGLGALVLAGIGGALSLVNKAVWLIPPTIGAVAIVIGSTLIGILNGIGTTILAVLGNLAKNFMDFGKAAWNFLKNPAGGFDFKLTGLMDGVKAQADKLPDMMKPGVAGANKELDEIRKREEAARAAMGLPFAGPGAPGAPAPSGMSPERAAALASPGGMPSTETPDQKAAKELTTWLDALKKKAETPLERYAAGMAKLKLGLDSGQVKAEDVPDLQEKLGLESFKGVLDKLETPLEKFRKSMGDLDDALGQGLVSQDKYDRAKKKEAGEAFGLDLQSKGDKYAASLERINGAKSAGFLGGDRYDKEKRDAGLEAFDIKSLVEGIKTPMAKYQETLAKLAEARDAGVISDLEYTKGAMASAKDEGLAEPTKFAGAADLGSTEAYSAIVSAFSGRGTDSLEKLAQQQLAATREGNRIASGKERPKTNKELMP